MAEIHVYSGERIAAIKPVHGVGQPPFQGLKFPMFHYLTEASIPYSRLHDVGNYMSGRLVDIHCIFRNFDADPTDPASYDFAFTDRLITALMEAGVEPVFRLGETIENYADVKCYHVHPPKDFLQWARICEGIIRHYTEGWADGFHYDIRYWEIWNEPEGSGDAADPACGTWTGTTEQFFAFYTVAAKHLKKCFPNRMIGGYAGCGFRGLGLPETASEELRRTWQFKQDYFHRFLAWIKRENAPLDFYSWHTYDKSIENNRKQLRYARVHLDEAGFTETETTCNEWNCGHDERATAHHAAFCAGMLSMFQDEPIENAMFYDARLGPSIYGGLFNPLTHGPLPSYYAFFAWGDLYRRGSQIRLTSDDARLYATAAEDESGTAVLLANPSETSVPLTLTGLGKIKECRIIDENRMWEECELPAALDANTTLYVLAEKN